MSSVHNRNVLISRAESEMRLNKWAGSRTVTVVGLFILSQNLPRKLWKKRTKMRKKPKGAFTCSASIWRWPCIRDFWQYWEFLGGCPLAPGTWECTPCVARGFDTMRANQPILAWFSARCWHSRQKDTSDAVWEENARLRGFGGWYTRGPRLGPIRDCTRTRAAYDQRPNDGSNGCDPTWVWLVRQSGKVSFWPLQTGNTGWNRRAGGRMSTRARPK